MDRAGELEAFKGEINLTEYAAARGYGIDREQSTRGSVAMRHENGDKVVISRGTDGRILKALAARS